jgi:hypothetical protein
MMFAPELEALVTVIFLVNMGFSNQGFWSCGSLALPLTLCSDGL